MRPGNLEDFGWNKIVRDLDRAIALARLSGIQSVLMQAAREASWGESAIRGEESKPFTLSPRGLAKVLGCDHAQIVKAQNDLIKMQVFARTDDGQLVINKDYRTWVDTAPRLQNPPLFTQVELDYITEPKRKKVPRSGVKNNTSAVSKNTPLDDEAVSKNTPGWCQKTHHPVSKTTPATNDRCQKTHQEAPAQHKERAHAGAPTHAGQRDLREREIKRDLHPLPPQGGSGGGGEVQMPLAQRPEFKARLRELCRWYLDTHPSDSSITHVHIELLLLEAPDHPDWVKDAIKEALLGASANKSRYAMACLERRKADPAAWEREKKERAAKRQKGGKRRDERVVEYPILTMPPLPEES